MIGGLQNRIYPTFYVYIAILPFRIPVNWFDEMQSIHPNLTLKSGLNACVCHANLDLILLNNEQLMTHLILPENTPFSETVITRMPGGMLTQPAHFKTYQSEVLSEIG